MLAESWNSGVCLNCRNKMKILKSPTHRSLRSLRSKLLGIRRFHKKWKLFGSRKSLIFSLSRRIFSHSSLIVAEQRGIRPSEE